MKCRLEELEDRLDIRRPPHGGRGLKFKEFIPPHLSTVVAPHTGGVD